MQYAGSADHGKVALDNDWAGSAAGSGSRLTGVARRRQRRTDGARPSASSGGSPCPAHDPADDARAGVEPRWAPDGRSIAFVGTPTAASALGVWSVPVGGGPRGWSRRCLRTHLVGGPDVVAGRDEDRLRRDRAGPRQGLPVEHISQIYVTTTEGGIERFNEPWAPPPRAAGPSG